MAVELSPSSARVAARLAELGADVTVTKLGASTAPPGADLERDYIKHQEN